MTELMEKLIIEMSPEASKISGVFYDDKLDEAFDAFDKQMKIIQDEIKVKKEADEPIEPLTMGLNRFKSFLLAHPEYDDDFAMSILFQAAFHLGKLVGVNQEESRRKKRMILKMLKEVAKEMKIDLPVDIKSSKSD